MESGKQELDVHMPPGTRGAAALQRLVHEQGDLILNYLRRQIPPDLRRLLEPQDILQDALFEGFQRLSEFSPDDKDGASRWLMTIARNRLIDAVRMHRAAKRGIHRVTEVRHGSVIALLADLAVYNRTPSRSAAAHELLAEVDTAIGRLLPDYQDAVRLRYIQGLSLKETALKMNRSDGAVQMLALRGLNALRVEMRSVSLFV